jgi:[CysO sulfur-carrier protein]-S-L-cysteine hydrolase
MGKYVEQSILKSPCVIMPTCTFEAIEHHAKTAYPNECCGLLIGRSTKNTIQITYHTSSENVSDESKRDNFEIDPRIRFEVMRELQKNPDLSIIGHYHSHPNHSAAPSEKDKQMTFEPHMVWVIMSVNDCSQFDIAAYLFDTDLNNFNTLPITVVD